MSEAKTPVSGGLNKCHAKATDNQSDESEKSKRLYINLLNKYNEIKDATQIVLGVIANAEGTTVKKIHEKFDLPLND